MEDLRVDFNDMRVKTGLHPLEGCLCNCEDVYQSIGEGHCCASLCTFFGVTAMLEAILCPKFDDSEWHARKCVFWGAW